MICFLMFPVAIAGFDSLCFVLRRDGDDFAKHYPARDILESNCRLIADRRWHSRYSPYGD
jgi:hypothetical protein